MTSSARKRNERAQVCRMAGHVQSADFVCAPCAEMRRQGGERAGRRGQAFKGYFGFISLCCAGGPSGYPASSSAHSACAMVCLYCQRFPASACSSEGGLGRTCLARAAGHDRSYRSHASPRLPLKTTAFLPPLDPHTCKPQRPNSSAPHSCTTSRHTHTTQQPICGQSRTSP